MLFTQLCKQMWFVCLMAFAIGWSSVSVASVKTMHLDMQHGQMQLKMQGNQPLSDGSFNDHEMAKMSAEQMRSHCQQMMQLDSEQKAPHGSSQNDISQKVSSSAIDQSQYSSCMTTSDTGQMQHKNCPDCSLMACQAMIVWLNVQSLQWSNPSADRQNSPFISTYQAQHLSGHWQEILRPPKA